MPPSKGIRDIVIVDRVSGLPLQSPSNFPGSPASMRSLRPMAASVPPRSILPPADASAERPSRARGRRSVATAILAAAVVVTGAGVWQSHRAMQRHVPVPEVVSGRAGLRSTQTGAHERWAGPVALTLDASLDTIDPKAKDAIAAAFAAWAAAGLGTPTVTITSDGKAGSAAQDGVSRVLFGPITIPGHEKDVAATIGYADTDSGELREADIILNSAYLFTVVGEAKSAAASGSTGTGSDTSDGSNDEGNGDGSEDDGKSDGKSGTVGASTVQPACAQQYDVQNVTTHEAGHLFGLGEDVDDNAATMFLRSSPCETHKRVLTATDQSVMAALYAEPAPVKAPAAVGCGGAAQIASVRASSSYGGGFWILAAALSLFGVRRARRAG